MQDAMPPHQLWLLCVIKIHGLDDAFDHSINDGSFWMNVVMPPRMMGLFG